MASDAPDLSASEDAAWRSMIVIWRLGFARLDRTFRRHGLIHLEYGILAVLSEAPDSTMPAGELADLSGLSTSHLSHRLKVMEQRGDIARTAGTTDRRMVTVTLTSQGRELLERVAPEHAADVHALMFEPLSASETRTLATLLAKIAGQLSSHPFAAQPTRPK